MVLVHRKKMRTINPSNVYKLRCKRTGKVKANVFELDACDQKTIRNKINRFIEQHDELILCEQNLKCVIDLYSRWFYNPNRKTKTFANKVLRYLFDRLFWSKVDDSQYVAAYLRFLYEAEHDFYYLMVPQRVCPSLINVETRVLEYYLFHAYEAKLIIYGQRLLQIHVAFIFTEFWNPIDLAFLKRDHQMLRQILSYGAMFSIYEHFLKLRNDDCEHGKFLRFIADIFKFRYGIMGNRHRLNQDLGETALYNETLLCSSMILKDIPNWIIPLNALHEYIEEDADSEHEELKIFRHNLLSNFKQYFTDAMSLKQICRLSIRRSLNTNWFLPRGIYTLPLPRLLQNYLN